MKKAAIVLLIALSFLHVLNAQHIDWGKIEQNNPDKILMEEGYQPTEVLILGTFHFGYPQADGHKIDSSKFIDVLSAERQKEIEELAGIILKFHPTRVYIEAWNPSFHDSLFHEFLENKYQLGRNEVYQIGYRVAKNAGMKKIYPVDAGNFASDNYEKYAWLDSMWNYQNYVDTIRDKYWDKRYEQWYDASDSIGITMTMLENFILMAEPSTLNRMHGAYLSNYFNTTGNEGPDILAMWWYSRNLRIYNNILKTLPQQNDRIILLIGNGHVPILKQCFSSSPEFRVVELKDLLIK
ncbi:MAG: hypothetical protein H7Y00_05165 [Fimbriimonadaceae bacterium]|nr:hypothetical protein [Chitinophagales bacterium]